MMELGSFCVPDAEAPNWPIAIENPPGVLKVGAFKAVERATI